MLLLGVLVVLVNIGLAITAFLDKSIALGIGYLGNIIAGIIIIQIAYAKDDIKKLEARVKMLEDKQESKNSKEDHKIDISKYGAL